MALQILKLPLVKLRILNLSSTSTVDGEKFNGVSAPPSPSSRSPEEVAEERRKRSESRKRKSMDRKKRESLGKRIDQSFLEVVPGEGSALYKPLSMNMSKRRENGERFLLEDLDVERMVGMVVTFRARMHTLRRLSAKLVFVVLRQQTVTIQGVLQSPSDHSGILGMESPSVSESMIRSIERYPLESIVLVTAKIRRPPQAVKNVSIHDAELDIRELHLVSSLTEHPPFTVYEAANSDKLAEDDSETDVDDCLDDGSKRGRSIDGIKTKGILKKLHKNSASPKTHVQSIPQRVRLNNRIIDLRTAPAQSIFRIQAGVCNIFRSYLDGQGFMEIHTPKLQAGATESGATVFEVKYFGRPAFLAQSPQLAKQMCIASDFERVYEIGPIFRAEDSNTPRHMTEFTGMDIEMALEEHYHEALEIIDGMFKHLWQTLYGRYQKEIDIISQYFPHEKVLWLDKTPRIPFSEGICMLEDDGWTDDDGNPPSELEDLPTRAEIRLGQLVREKYKTDYYILDKFPASARPFYTMLDPIDNNFTNSFDIFMRGQEILSGGQRIHDARFLEKRMRDVGVKPEMMEEYMEGFRWGAPPHAGAGIGLERLLFLFLNLGNIRLASLFPRDPKSIPSRPQQFLLRHPEASTTEPPWENPSIPATDPTKTQLQPLEKLIANYGDAANTSWLDLRYEVWRHPSTGAAQGFVTHENKYAITVGSPLCAASQQPQIVSAYLEYLRTTRRGLKPIWLLVPPALEEYLGEKCNWRSLSVIAEERVCPRDNPAWKDADLARKIRHAEKEGVRNYTVSTNAPPGLEWRERVDVRIRDWQRNRKGKQVHLTEIRPWVDMEHRRYFYAASSSPSSPTGTSPLTPPTQTLQALLVLAQLSPSHGWQIKFSLEFPSAPSGTIESLTLHTMSAVAALEPSLESITFGTGAMEELQGGRNVGKSRLKVLKRTYEGINKGLGLTRKSEFREKLGAKNERVFIAYPRGGLGVVGIRALLAFFGAEGEGS